MLPWSSFWSRNYFVTHWPGIAPWLVNDFVRGAVTGLGIVSLIAAIADLLPVFGRADRSDGPVRRSAEREGG